MERADSLTIWQHVQAKFSFKFSADEGGLTKVVVDHESTDLLTGSLRFDRHHHNAVARHFRRKLFGDVADVFARP